MWSEVEETSCFPSKCSIRHTGEYCSLLNDNRTLWIRGAEECRAIRLNISALLCYPLERKRRDGTMSVKGVSCVKVLTEWLKKKFLKGAPWKVWNFHQNIKFMRCMEAFLWALFDLHDLSLEYLFSSAKPLVRGQCSALKSHIAVCKPRRWSQNHSTQLMLSVSVSGLVGCGDKRNRPF